MVEFVKTKSFSLAVYSRGKPDSKMLALVLPGKLDTKDYPNMRSHVDFLASKGFLAVSFDPPGTWESPGDISLYTMTNYLGAINELIDYFGNKPTILVGHSRGGTMAMLACENKFVVGVVVVMSHSSPGVSIPMGILGKVSVRDCPNGGVREFVLPKSFFVDEKNYDAFEVFSKCTKPKLLVLGKKDVLIKPVEVKRLFDACVKPKELFELDGGHDYRRSPRLIAKLNKELLGFLEKYSVYPD